MAKILTRRLLLFPLVLAVVYSATFALIAAAPGDPLLGDSTKATPEVLEQQRRFYGLDQPWYVRYAQYPWTIATEAAKGRLQLGLSIQYGGRPVAEVLGLTADTWSHGAMQTSLTLGALALAIAVAVGVNVGLWAGAKQNGALDQLATGISVIGVSLPPFVVGSLLILLLTVATPAFPVVGWGSWRQMILPAITLSLPFMAYIARLMRSSVLDVLGGDYIRTARAKGLAERKVIYKHAFKLAFLPVLSFLGPAAAAVMTGSFVVERLFAVPGMGQHFTDSVINRDQPLILGTVLLYSVLLVSFNLLVDLAYMVVDPRIGREAV